MKKIDPGQAITILANLGVIAGIGFLALELRQNNELMASQDRYNRLSVRIGSYQVIVENPDMADLLVKSDQSVESLSSAEQERLLAYAGRVLLNMEWTFNELPYEESTIANWRRVAERTYFKLYWEERRNELDPKFARFLEENVIK